MNWIDDLREELQRRQALVAAPASAAIRRSMEDTVSDDTVAQVDMLVRTLHNQMNQVLLGGRGSVWAVPSVWGAHMWELWWEPTRERGPYLMVVLLRDSRGTPYLKVQGRRLTLEDARLERRLQRALRSAFLSPLAATSEAQEHDGTARLVRPTSPGSEPSGDGISGLRPDTSPAQPGAVNGNQDDETWARARRGQRSERRNGRDNK